MYVESTLPHKVNAGDAGSAVYIALTLANIALALAIINNHALTPGNHQRLLATIMHLHLESLTIIISFLFSLQSQCAAGDAGGAVRFPFFFYLSGKCAAGDAGCSVLRKGAV